MIKGMVKTEAISASLEEALDALSMAVLEKLIDSLARYSDGFQKPCRILLDSKEKYALMRPKFLAALKRRLTEQLRVRYAPRGRLRRELTELGGLRLSIERRGPLSYLCFEIGPEEAPGGAARLRPQMPTREPEGKGVPF